MEAMFDESDRSTRVPSKFVTPRNILPALYEVTKMFQDRSSAFSIVSKGREREILRFYRKNYSKERKKEVVTRRTVVKRHAINWRRGREKKKVNLPVKFESESSSPSLEISSVINNYVNVSLSIAFATCPSV